MASRVIGLDVGTHAVRAAELSLARDGGATLERFGQVALPVGAVVNGEVIDPPAVSAALRRLWAEVGFRQRRAIVGVGNQRVIVRQAELPAMSEDELRSALRFEVQELIPIPVEEAILDFQVLESVVGPEQEALTRILLVAAQRDMVRSLLASLEGAGLGASMVDVVPFALMRALATTNLDLGEGRGPAEAIVGIGAGVTNMVVHEQGIPRFVRMLVVGGHDVTEAIAGELGVEVDAAEDLKRRADRQSFDALEARAGGVIDTRMGPLLEEIRGSLDYYLAQSDAVPISRILITGGGSRLPDLPERLQQLTGLPVEVAHPLLGVRVGRTGIPEERLLDAEALLAVPIGLALAGRPAEAGRRRLTLLPSEVGAVQEQRRQATLVGAGVGVLALLLVLLWATQAGDVSDERERAEQAEVEVESLRRQIAALAGATDLEAQLQERRELVTAALADDVAWTRLLQEIATAMPNDVWLESFQGSKGEGTVAGGVVSVSARGFDHTSAARWLLRIGGEVSSLTNVWLPSSAREGTGPGDLVTFSSTAVLTESARSDRLRRYLEGE